MVLAQSPARTRVMEAVRGPAGRGRFSVRQRANQPPFRPQQADQIARSAEMSGHRRCPVRLMRCSLGCRPRQVPPIAVSSHESSASRRARRRWYRPRKKIIRAKGVTRICIPGANSPTGITRCGAWGLTWTSSRAPTGGGCPGIIRSAPVLYGAASIRIRRIGVADRPDTSRPSGNVTSNSTQ